MKRTVISILCLLMWAGLAVGQTQFNIKAGANLTNSDDDYEEGEIDGRAGYQIGFEVRFGDRVYLSPGLYYFKHRSRIDFIEGGIGGIDLPDYKVTFEGLRVPFYVGGDLIKGPNWGARVYTGPNASFVWSTNDGLPGYEDDAFRDIHWGFNGGLGLDMGVLTVDLSYEWRLNNVFEGSTPEFKNNIAYLTVGLLF